MRYSMNQIMIYGITIFSAVLGFLSLENKHIPMNRIFQSVHKAYGNLLQYASKLGGVLIKLCLVIMVLLVMVLSYERSSSLLEGTQPQPYQSFILLSCLFVILIITIYFTLGIGLLIFSKIENLIPTIHKRRLSFRFLISAFILLVYAFFLWYIPNEMKICGKTVMAGLLISYLINMLMLVNISMEPLTCACCKCKENAVEKKYPLKIMLAGALILILLIVINLYLGVIMIANIYEQPYAFAGGIQRKVTYFDLFYYTVISFTTIGYGEIVPCRIESKWMAIVIACTSVMCLVIFVSSILALKEKLNG